MIVTYPKLGDYVLNKLESKLPEEASTQGSVFRLNSYRKIFFLNSIQQIFKNSKLPPPTPLKTAWPFILTNLNSLYLRMLYAKFD